MRTWLYLGSVAVAIAFIVYDWYNNRPEGPHNAGGQGGSYRPPFMDDEEHIEVGSSNRTKKKQSTQPPVGETCAICLDPLIRLDEARKYCITQLPCNHWFHQRCALRLLEYHPECPICRKKIDGSVFRATPTRVGESEPQ